MKTAPRWPGVLRAIGLVAVLAAPAACSRKPPSPTDDAGAAVPDLPEAATGSCTTHEQIAAAPCRTGARSVDALPPSAGVVLELSHCPLDDCGSGGCSYEVYGLHQGCLRSIGTVHGASIDVSAPDAGAPSIRTWGRSGTTHVATDYELEAGRLVRRREFVCDYGTGQPMPAECPKL